MPIYMYRCNDCDYEFEQHQRMADEPLTECPVCEDGRIRRVLNSIGVVFKGSGFYVTDNRGKKTNGTSSNDSTSKTSTTDETNGKTSETTSSSSESKPEKSEPKKKETASTTE